jgi:hypothetical protein
MQIDNQRVDLPSASVLWDWQMNIDVGKYILQQKHDEPLKGAHAFWAEQVRQFRAWNDSHDPDKAPPANTTFNGYTFAYEPTGTQKSYEDAIWIKYYNGAYEGHYIAWKNDGPYVDNPEWQFHRLNNAPEKGGYDYVEKVCNELP